MQCPRCQHQNRPGARFCARTGPAGELRAPRYHDLAVVFGLTSALFFVTIGLLAILLVITPGLAGDESAGAWAALVEGGHVAVIRHGNAPPGHGGDPPGFRFDDCKTQRNLDEVGREQARAVGEAFRQHGVHVDRIVSSPVCRCLETGRLMALLPDAGPSPTRFLDLKEMVSSWHGPGTLVLVTHALTVGPLVGFLPEQAETVVLQPAPGNPRGGSLVGRIAPPR